jgi:hypothetical protein
MSKQEMIFNIIEEKLISVELKEKYLNLLIVRIDENRKLIAKLFTIMLLTVFAFPLIIETKISEILVGPFKLNDNSIAISIIPSIFAYCYYKYISVWIDLVEQKNVFKELTAIIFNVESKSFLNERIRPYSFIDSIINYHLEDNSKKVGCINSLLWLPIMILFLIFPFLFEYYAVKILYLKYGLDTILEWFFFIIPVLSGLFTIIMLFQVGKKDIKRNNETE